jgi:hypothetical protein
MKTTHLIYIWIILILSFFIFYFQPNFFDPVSKDYIGILIFFFATLTGVFIARQGNRYNLIVKGITDFNGSLSFQYRNMEMIDKKYQNELAKIIKKYFQKYEKNKK